MSPYHRAFALLAAAIVLLACSPPAVQATETFAESPADAVFDHAPFDRILRQHVRADGLVDYRALLGEPAELDAYIAALATAPFDELDRDDRLALLINAYNAFTLRLILDHYPVDSIRDIPGNWDEVRWKLAGQVYSLNQIEHELVRPNFDEPRIHFALVCAAIGCPKLRNEAYSADRLEAQLEDQTRHVHGHPRWFEYGGGVAKLTKLYDWYGGDFEGGSVLAFAAKYSEELAADLARGERPRIEFLDYDWALNEVAPPRPGK